MINFLKAIIVGMGGIAPGLSGSVLLVIFGLYGRVIGAVSSVFKNFKRSISFLIPIVLGFGVGILLFSKVIDLLLLHFEMQTRFAFLGLILGTLPLFYKEVRRHGYKKRYFGIVGAAAVCGLCLLIFGRGLFPTVTDPGFFESVLLGFAVAASSIVPGVDSAVILSALGLYEIYVSSLASLDLTVLLPALIGLAVGAVVISLIMNFLIKRFYTVTFSVIFGFFISIIPCVLNESCTPGMNATTVVSFILVPIGFLISFYLGDIEGNNVRILRLLGKSVPAKPAVPEGAIDILSTSDDRVAAALSNFSHFPFVIDGVECGGMEGFLQSLKYGSPRAQRRVAALHGKDAKEAGTDKTLWRLTGKLYWNGKPIARESAEFDALICRAYDELFAQSPAFREALAASIGRPLCHSIGKNKKRQTVLTTDELIFNLERLRSSLSVQENG